MTDLRELLHSIELRCGYMLNDYSDPKLEAREIQRLVKAALAQPEEGMVRDEHRLDFLGYTTDGKRLVTGCKLCGDNHECISREQWLAAPPASPAGRKE